MTEKTPPRTSLLPSDIDAQGNVTLWDHGPGNLSVIPRETEEQTAARAKAHDADIAEWHRVNGDGPLALVMHSSDAGSAMMHEPGRYALEPDGIDEDEIKKRMQEMRDKREAAANSVQFAIDRRLAIAGIMSDRAQKKAIDESEQPISIGINADEQAAASAKAVAEQNRIAAEKAIF